MTRRQTSLGTRLIVAGLAPLCWAGLAPVCWLLTASALPAQVVADAAEDSLPSDPELRQLVKDARLQIDLVYRYDRRQKEARLEAVRETLSCWRQASKGPAEREAVRGWLKQAIRASMPGSSTAMPAALVRLAEPVALPETVADPVNSLPPLTDTDEQAGDEIEGEDDLTIASGEEEGDEPSVDPPTIAPPTVTPPTIADAWDGLDEAPDEATADELATDSWDLDAPAPELTESEPTESEEFLFDEPAGEDSGLEEPAETALAAARRLWAESPAAAPLEIDPSFTTAYAAGGSPSSRAFDAADRSDDEPASAPPAASRPRGALSEVPIDAPTFAAADGALLVADAGRRQDATSASASRFVVRKPTLELAPVDPPMPVSVAEVRRRVERFNADLDRLERKVSSDADATAFQIDNWCSRLKMLGEQRGFVAVYAAGVEANDGRIGAEITPLDDLAGLLRSRIDDRRASLADLPDHAVKRESAYLRSAEQRLDDI